MGRNVTGITLDRERRLYYRISDGCDIETALGMSVIQALGRAGFREVVVFLWAGLRHEDDKLTQERLKRILDRCDLDLAALWEKVTEALIASGLMRAPGPESAPDPTSAPPLGVTGA